jgi:hypothetical protein
LISAAPITGRPWLGIKISGPSAMTLFKGDPDGQVIGSLAGSAEDLELHTAQSKFIVAVEQDIGVDLYARVGWRWRSRGCGQRELGRVAEREEAGKARLVIEKLDLVALGNELCVGAFPQRHSAGVVAVTVGQDYVLDRTGIFSLQEFHVVWSCNHVRCVDDYIAFAGSDHESIPESYGLIDGVADFESFGLIHALAQDIDGAVDSLLLRVLGLGPGRDGRQKEDAGRDPRELSRVVHFTLPSNLEVDPTIAAEFS